MSSISESMQGNGGKSKGRCKTKEGSGARSLHLNKQDQVQWDRSNYTPQFGLYPPPNHSLAEILIPPSSTHQDTRGKLGDNFNLYPPKTQPSQNSYTPRGIIRAIPLCTVSRVLTRVRLTAYSHKSQVCRIGLGFDGPWTSRLPQRM